MSAKLLHALSDDNPDLQKQIGCMTGIFQLFDRQHFISGRRLYGHHHRRLPSSAHPHFSNNKIGAEESAVSPRTSFAKAQTRNQKKIVDSAVDSQSSSSCSSSFSSVDYSRNSHSEPVSSSQSLKNTKKVYNPSIDKKNGASSSWNDQSNFMAQTGRQSIDFRDIVKESMYREGQGLSTNSRTKQETANHLMTTKDSPESLQVPRLMDECSFQSTNRKPRVPVDLNESLRILASLKDGPWYLRGSTYPTRGSEEVNDASLCSLLRECPRFSYDGREIPRNSFDSRENIKSTTKLKELPRLSLDGRDCPSRSSKLDVKPNCVSKDFPNYLNQGSNENQQSPSIVAKLMGLEALPRSTQISDANEKTLNSKNTRSNSTGPSKVSEGNKPNTFSSKVLQDQVVAHGGNAENMKKSIGSPRFPIETAPWSLPEGSRLPVKKNNKSHDLPTKLQASQFIFSEVEKRLKDIKFQHSERDLMAILDAMQARLQMDAQNVQVPAPKLHTSQTTTVKLRDRTMSGGGPTVSVPTKESCSPRALDSPIVIMKPAKTIKKSNIGTALMHSDIVSIPLTNASTRDLQHFDARHGSKQDKIQTQKFNSKNSENQSKGDANKKINSKYEEKKQRLQNASSRPLHISSKPQNTTKDNTSISPKSSGSSSPRLHLRKLEAERKSKPPSCSSSDSKPKKPTARQQDSGQRGSKLLVNSTPRSVESVPLGDQTSDISNNTARHLNNQGDSISVRSDSDISFASQLDVETMGVNHSLEMNGIQNSSTECNMHVKTEEVSPNLGDERRLIASGVHLEQPSPVSVLDQSYYKDDLLCSPEQKTPCPLNDGRVQWARDEESSKSSTSRHLSNTKRSLDFSSRSHENKLASVEDLVWKLQQLNASHDESTKDHIASLCEKTSPDHRYVSEMLLASGLLLKDLSSDTMNPILPHSSGNVINPDLFGVLEKTKASRLDKDQPDDAELTDQEKMDRERLHRRLLFDTANEILISRLPVLDSEPCLPTPMLAMKVLSGQRLLHDICAEIDGLAGDRSGNLDDVLSQLTRHLDNWSNQGDISVVVLDIERMIFKDLVDEIVNARGWTSKMDKQNRNRHQTKIR